MIDYHVWPISAVKSSGTREQNSIRSFHAYSHTRLISRCSDGNKVYFFSYISNTILVFRTQTVVMTPVTSADQMIFFSEILQIRRDPINGSILMTALYSIHREF